MSRSGQRDVSCMDGPGALPSRRRLLPLVSSMSSRCIVTAGPPGLAVACRSVFLPSPLSPPFVMPESRRRQMARARPRMLRRKVLLARGMDWGRRCSMRRCGRAVETPRGAFRLKKKASCCKKVVSVDGNMSSVALVPCMRNC